VAVTGTYLGSRLKMDAHRKQSTTVWGARTLVLMLGRRLPHRRAGVGVTRFRLSRPLYSVSSQRRPICSCEIE
jgi:hypothetical protein